MAILAECPVCHVKQKVLNRLCLCGENLVKAKQSKRVRYWINYRLPGGKQRRESVGYSIEEARDADGKRRSQKRENRIFDIIPEARMTFRELATWYVNLEVVKELKSYARIKIALNQFNTLLGNRIVNSIKPVDLENYQNIRKHNEKAPATIDMEISIAKSVIKKAFDNDMVGGHTLKAFRIKKLLKKNTNARDRILSIEEFNRLMKLLPLHTRVIIGIAYYTGMRKNEITSLTWDKVDLKKNKIQLEAADTKDKEPRKFRIYKELLKILNSIPRAIHDDHVILFEGKPIHDIRAALRTACRNAGIAYGRFVKGGFVFHDIRHTFNTNMRKAGVAQSVIMKITGHSTNEMFERYNTIDEDDINQAFNQFGRFLEKEEVPENVDQSVD